MKHDPEELHEIAAELDGIVRCHRDILNDEPRILNPILEAVRAAKTKYDDMVEVRPVGVIATKRP